ncbi:MAG TPA: YlxR family protein [Cellulomonas sp.]|nr:YlxR family protein [Cellulomonas sp.]
MGPVRTCVGCRLTDQRSVLLRIIVSTDTAGTPALVVDAGRCMPGRGAWLHPDRHCLELAERRRAFPRALRHAGPLDVAAVEACLAGM